MEFNFFFWWSIVSTLISVVLLCWGIWQLASHRQERESHKSQVKIWQHYANGIKHSLSTMSWAKYSSVEDLKSALASLAPVADSLYTSLNEERLFSEEEIKQKQVEEEQEMRKRLDSMRKSTPEDKK